MGLHDTTEVFKLKYIYRPKQTHFESFRMFTYDGEDNKSKLFRDIYWGL